MDQEKPLTASDLLRREGEADERARWRRALREIGFEVSPGLSVIDNLIEFGKWWKVNADRFDGKH